MRVDGLGTKDIKTSQATKVIGSRPRNAVEHRFWGWVSILCCVAVGGVIQGRKQLLPPFLPSATGRPWNMQRATLQPRSSWRRSGLLVPWRSELRRHDLQLQLSLCGTRGHLLHSLTLQNTKRSNQTDGCTLWSNPFHRHSKDLAKHSAPECSIRLTHLPHAIDHHKR